MDPSLEIRHLPYDEVYGQDFEDLGRRAPDVTRLREAVGFAPERSLTEILQDTLAHMRLATGPAGGA